MSIQAVKQPAATPSRMTLKSILKGKQDSPIRIVVYGAEGIGKSTFAANAPKPIFLAPEEGTLHLDVERFPTPETWPEVLSAISVLRNEKHDYQTLVFDTLDSGESLIHDYICKRDGKANLEAYTYGKGVVIALDEWRNFLFQLEQLQKERGLNVILLAHSIIKPFKSPEMDSGWDRYEMKLHNKAAALCKEWAQAVLFANYETALKKDGQTKRVRGIDTGSRLLHTQWTAAFDAKNRYSLPETLPLDWAEFHNAVHSGQVAEPRELRVEIERKAKELGGQLEVKTLESIKRNFDDATKLAALNSWVNVKLNEKEERR